MALKVGDTTGKGAVPGDDQTRGMQNTEWGAGLAFVGPGKWEATCLGQHSAAQSKGAGL